MMYDPFARGMIEHVPKFEGLTPDLTRQALSRAYLTLANLRLTSASRLADDLAETILFLRRLANTLESRAVFDAEVPRSEQQASAFVSAEALSLCLPIFEV